MIPARSLLPAVGTLLVAMGASADTYWVSPTGKAEWLACQGEVALADDLACPIETANTNGKAGDTVYLRQGTYSGKSIKPSQSGSSSTERLIFTHYEPDEGEVIIRDSRLGIDLSGRSWVAVHGFRFQNMGEFFQIYDGSHNDIGECWFDQRGAASGEWAGAIISRDPDATSGEGSTHNRVHHCSFTRWSFVNTIEGETYRGGALLNVGVQENQFTDESCCNLIEHNLFAYAAHNTLGVYSKRNVIRGNYFHNEDGTDWLAGFDQCRSVITEGKMAGSCLYEGNRFGFSGASGLALRSSNNIIRFNTFYKNGSGGIQAVANGDQDRVDGNRIYHDTFYRNGFSDDYSGFQGGLYFSNWNGIDPVDNVVKNNVFFDNKNGEVSYDGTFPRPTVESNWDNDVDPGFVSIAGDDPSNPDLPDLRLKEGGPADLQGGAWLTTITSPDRTSNTFAVADARYFMDGWDTIDGDLVQLEDQEVPVRIAKVDYTLKTIELESEVTFHTGQGVALAHTGSGPHDLGAYALADYEGPGSGALPDSDPSSGSGGSGGGCGQGAAGTVGLLGIASAVLAAARGRRRSARRVSRGRVLGLVLLAVPVNGAHAVEVDIYQNMESGSPGQQLTEEIMKGSSFGGDGAVAARWTFEVGDKLWVSNEYSMPLPGAVVVGGADRNTAGSRTWSYYNNYNDDPTEQDAKVWWTDNQNGTPYRARMTIAAFYTSDQTDPFSVQHDTIVMTGEKSFCVLQTIGDAGHDPPYVRAHSCVGPWANNGCKTTVSPAIKIVTGQTYWVNLHFDGVAGRCVVAVYDPKDWKQVGQVEAAANPDPSQIWSNAQFGQCSDHTPAPHNQTQAFFDHIMIDFTDPPFTLLPDTVDPVPDPISGPGDTSSSAGCGHAGFGSPGALLPILTLAVLAIAAARRRSRSDR